MAVGNIKLNEFELTEKGLMMLEDTELKRGAGILLPISSLPSPYGIGTIGKEAYNFIDFLQLSGQSYWQILPTSPTAFGNSPYQSPSVFAGNTLLIDLDLLVIDEVGVQSGTENERNILFDIINGRYENMKSTLIITNLDRSQLPDYLGERIVDRLRENGGMLIPISGKSCRK